LTVSASKYDDKDHVKIEIKTWHVVVTNDLIANFLVVDYGWIVVSCIRRYASGKYRFYSAPIINFAFLNAVERGTRQSDRRTLRS